MSEQPVQARILVIEDDRPIRRFLLAALRNHGYEVVEAATGRMGLSQILGRIPDVIILDLGLPDMDGMELLKQVREWSQVPIIVLSARGREDDKVTALNGGADDYLTKPFGVSELLARIGVALRHAARLSSGSSEQAPQFTVGDLKVDLAARRVYVRGSEVHMTPLEYRLLAAFVRHPGKVLTHRFLLSEVWGPSYEEQSHYLRMFVASLRRKLEEDPADPRYLFTEQGVGYRLAED